MQTKLANLIEQSFITELYDSIITSYQKSIEIYDFLSIFWNTPTINNKYKLCVYNRFIQEKKYKLYHDNTRY